MKESESKVLCVDLDGTLIEQDSTRSLLYIAFSRRPYETLVTILKSRLRASKIKQEISSSGDLESHSWKINETIVQFIIQSRENGIKTWLVTGSHSEVATYFSLRTGLFDGHLNSDDQIKLKGQKKAQTLIKYFGKEKFDYIGDAIKDRHIFKYTNNAFAPIKSKKKMLLFRKRYKIIFL